MKPTVHYSVKAKLILSKKENGEFDFLEINKEFYDNNPIIARENAFRYYQNYIEVILESQGLKYESDRQARKVFESFYNPKTFSLVEGIEFPDSWGNGIGILMLTDDNINESSKRNNISIIHGIGRLWEGWDDAATLLSGLESEYDIYKSNGYDTGSYEMSIDFCNRDEWEEGHTDDEPQTYQILKTPFDWTGLDKPYWWSESKLKVQSPEKRLTIEDLITIGETNQIEFKPALHYNFKTQSAAIGVKGIIAKSIAGFLNSKGGFLLIGVNDDGNIQGLSYDFSLSGDKPHRDYFRLQFDDTIKQFLPLFIKDKISGEFYNIGNKEIFVVKVFPSHSKPIFMNGQHGKEFWVRWTASTKQYTDVEEIANYCLEHWRNKD